MMSKEFQLPDGFRWQEWIERWDKMQERYIVQRSERIELLIRLVGAARYPVRRVLDLGCGTGSLMQPFLDAYPEAEVYGLILIRYFCRLRRHDYAPTESGPR